MNRKIILLNLCLVALAGWLFWMLRLKWIELHAHEHGELAMAPVKQWMFPPPPKPLLKPMAASDYNDVAQKDLFAKDRNPNVIVELKPPPPAPAPPPMPPLPAFFGMMSLGDPVIVLKLPKGEQKSYHAGDKVGPFELVSFSNEKVVFDWDGQIIERTPDELREKDSGPQVAIAAPPPTLAAASASTARTIGAGPANEPKGSERLGIDQGSVRLCVAGDSSPAGTVEGNYKKKVLNGPFGQTCSWELVKP